jgi:hypothetical protein
MEESHRFTLESAAPRRRGRRWRTAPRGQRLRVRATAAADGSRGELASADDASDSPGASVSGVAGIARVHLDKNHPGRVTRDHRSLLVIWLDTATGTVPLTLTGGSELLPGSVVHVSPRVVVAVSASP